MKILLDTHIAFASNGKQPYLPLLPQDFENLYDILNKNFRSVLDRKDNYCQSVADRDLPKDDDQKHAFFSEWLTMESEDAHHSSHPEQILREG